MVSLYIVRDSRGSLGAKTNIKGVSRVGLRPVVGDRALLFYLDNLWTYDVKVIASPTKDRFAKSKWHRDLVMSSEVD
jgi:hypothetical protein